MLCILVCGNKIISLKNEAAGPVFQIFVPLSFSLRYYRNELKGLQANVNSFVSCNEIDYNDGNCIYFPVCQGNPSLSHFVYVII
jgi:hypothetical protein